MAKITQNAMGSFSAKQPYPVMPTYRSNGLPALHESEGELGWRWLEAECPSRCEERYIFCHTNELGET